MTSGVHSKVLTVAFEKQSDSNAMWALSVPIPFNMPVHAGAGGYFAPHVRSYIRRFNAPTHIGAIVAAKDRQNALKTPYAHLRNPDTTVESVLVNCHYPIDKNSFVLQYGVMVKKLPGVDREMANKIAGKFAKSFKIGFEQDVAHNALQSTDFALNDISIPQRSRSFANRLSQGEQTRLDGGKRVADFVCDAGREHAE